MTTEGIIGLYLETHDYAASAALWASLGFEAVFETDHGSGQWVHPAGGPYVFIAEQVAGGALTTHPILGVADADAFVAAAAAGASGAAALRYARPFTPQHWGVTEALLTDPDGREVSLQAPLPAGTDGPDADVHHADKYGHQ